jgi:hypothetical protein
LVIVPVAVLLAVAENVIVTFEPGAKLSIVHETVSPLAVQVPNPPPVGGVIIKVGPLVMAVNSDGSRSLRWIS